MKNAAVGSLAALAATMLSACGASGPDVDGMWVTASMNDGMECSMGRIMVIDGDRIDFVIGGQIMTTYEGLQTSMGENGHIMMTSDTATFEFEPGDAPGQMTILQGPWVMEHHTSRLPKELGRCGG